MNDIQPVLDSQLDSLNTYIVKLEEDGRYRVILLDIKLEVHRAGGYLCCPKLSNL